jgi:hypothetical protein
VSQPSIATCRRRWHRKYVQTRAVHSVLTARDCEGCVLDLFLTLSILVLHACCVLRCLSWGVSRAKYTCEDDGTGARSKDE